MKNKRKLQESYLKVTMDELEWFFMETGLAITVLDRAGNRIAHYGGGVDICRYIRLKLCGECEKCDKAALRWLLNGHELCEYLCHAGLSEAAALVRSDDGDYDGYVIIGKYLTEETLEESKVLMQKLSGIKGMNVSAVREAAEAMRPLNAEELDHALRCLSAVAKKFEETGCLKGLRDPDVSHALQMADKDRQQANCSTLYGEIHTTRRPTKAIFAEHCGETLSAFLTQRKMMRAEDMLMNTELSVKEISLRLGYDLCAFTKFFKRQYGDTPGHFRKYGEKDSIASDKNMRKENVPFRDRASKDDRENL